MCVPGYGAIFWRYGTEDYIRRITPLNLNGWLNNIIGFSKPNAERHCGRSPHLRKPKNNIDFKG